MTHDVLNDAEWPDLLERCRAVLDLEESAWETGAFRQARGVPSVEALLRLALGYGPGGLSLRQAAAWAAVDEVAELSCTALMKRLRNAADWLGMLAGALAAGRAAVSGSLGERPLCLVDGSVLTAPGSRGADWRLHVAYDPVGQRLLAVELTDASGAELLERAPVTADEIRLGDRVYGTRPEGVRAITDGPGDYVVRVGWRSLHWLDSEGERFDVLAFLERLGAAPIGEAEVQISRARKKKGFAPVPARLIAVRLPPEAVEKAQGRAQRASRKGCNPTRHADGGRLYAALDQPGREPLPGRAGGQSLSPQVASGTGRETLEIAFAYRPAAGQERGPGQSLALCPPDHRLANRRLGPGPAPGLSPLWTRKTRPRRRSRGPNPRRPRSGAWCRAWPAPSSPRFSDRGPSVTSSPPCRTCAATSVTRPENASCRCRREHVDAYGARPGHPRIDLLPQCSRGCPE
jgi:hypothetical protein